MSKFEDEIMQAIKKGIVSEVSRLPIVNISREDRRNVPKDIMDKVWDSVNWEDVFEELRPKIQLRICNAIIGSMETEIKTDVKHVLAIDGIRQRLRAEIYPQLMKILNDE